MKKMCRYCGKTHPPTYICPRKPVSQYQRKQHIQKFRNSAIWQRKRKEIRSRDLCLCQLCVRGLYTPDNGKLLDSNVQVHHIESLEQNFDSRLDNDNLICLCPYHHELAERGVIPYGEVEKVAIDQENKPPLPIEVYF